MIRTRLALTLQIVFGHEGQQTANFPAKVDLQPAVCYSVEIDYYLCLLNKLQPTLTHKLFNTKGTDISIKIKEDKK